MLSKMAKEQALEVIMEWMLNHGHSLLDYLDSHIEDEKVRSKLDAQYDKPCMESNTQAHRCLPFDLVDAGAIQAAFRMLRDKSLLPSMDQAYDELKASGAI